MGIVEFSAAARAVRLRLPALRPRIVALLAICDGLEWELAAPGAGLADRRFVRVRRGAILAGWEFIGRIVEKHASGGWEVDFGADYDQCCVVPPEHLHVIQFDLNVPGAIEVYMRQRANQGYRISRRLGPGGTPVDD